MNITAVVVTYNRLEKLKLVLNALEKQEFPLYKIIIVNNNSNDGTKEYLDILKSDSSDIFVHHASENLGGAGGFEKGIKIGLDDPKTDYVWVMDDDTIPDFDALTALISIADKHDAAFYSSLVHWKDGKIMNLPEIDKNNWAHFLEDEVIAVKTATFVSILINTEKIQRIGLPLGAMFIWGDDSEYTRRLVREYGPGLLVLKSQVEHRTEFFETERSVFSAPNELIQRFFFLYRNDMYIAIKHRGRLFSILKFFQLHLIAAKLLVKGRGNKVKKAATVVKAAWTGVLFAIQH